nr:signal peptidase II [Pelobacter propionicus]
MKYKILFTMFPCLLVLDQATKAYVARTMELYHSIPVVENFFNFTYLRNKGAAFSLFAQSGFRLHFLISVSLIAVIGIIYYYRKIRPDETHTAVGLTFILAGAVGNLMDRVRLGEVVDFLDAHWSGYHWPAFNLADSAIFAGVFILVVGMFIEERRLKVLKH